MANQKDYYLMQNVGKSKYVVNFHDGEKTHPDGSKFYDIKILRNKKALASFIRQLKRDGYTLR